ncbi:C40 family peptidase [Actinoplanes sp. CA-030573]|uniref:C40 family peptidase n=1 Tax=Actinoplanes sp. CA-030573 TaxID=3239898 RepID=UPI003D89ECD2
MPVKVRFTVPKSVTVWAFAALVSASAALLGAAPAEAAPSLRATARAGLTTAATAPDPAGSAGFATSAAVVLDAAAPAARRAASASAVRAAYSRAQLLRIRGTRVTAVASAQRGKPYRYGAAGPRAFDCSGLAGYAYRAVRVRLPRTANAQYHAAHPISRTAARPGDLVFWLQGGRAYHVAVYAGGGKVWHAPKAGDRVRLAKIWDPAHVRFGRVAL